MNSKMLLKDLDLSKVSSMMHLELIPLSLFFLLFPSQMIDHNRHECVFHGSCKNILSCGFHKLVVFQV